MALGAERGRVIAHGDARRHDSSYARLAIGVLLAMLCARYIKSQLYDITSVNPVVMAGAIVALDVAAAIAGIVLAKRAASINPARGIADGVGQVQDTCRPFRMERGQGARRRQPTASAARLEGARATGLCTPRVCQKD
jgi:hypothetical protein